MIISDLQSRLKIALDQVDIHTDLRRSLEAKVADLENQVQELTDEKSQIRSQIESYEEAITLLKSKNTDLKQEIGQLQTAVEHQTHDLQRLGAKLRRRTERLREIPARSNFEEALVDENNALKSLVHKLEKKQKSMSVHNYELDRERQELASENEQLMIKLSAHEQRAKVAGSVEAQLMVATAQVKEKSQDLVLMEQRFEDLQRKFGESNRLIEDLQARVSKGSSRLEAMKTENEDLKEQNRVLKAQADRCDALQSEVEALHKQVRSAPLRDPADVTRISELTRELEELGTVRQEHDATRIERDTLLQDVKLLQEKVTRLKAVEDRNQQLTLKIEDLKGTLAAVQISKNRSKEQIASLLHDREELEIVRRQLLQIEQEAQRKEETERKLRTKISNYRAKHREQSRQLETYEEELHELRNRLFTLQTDIVTVPRPVTNRSGRVARAPRKQSAREKLELQRKHNHMAENEIAELKHKVARYQAALDAKLFA
jgi:chromosome segregation ATPase